jgi:hypothetical protein
VESARAAAEQRAATAEAERADAKRRAAPADQLVPAAVSHAHDVYCYTIYSAVPQAFRNSVPALLCALPNASDLICRWCRFGFMVKVKTSHRTVAFQ